MPEWKCKDGYWYLQWIIPSDAVLGSYDVMVEVSDPDGGQTASTEIGEFTVTNSDPWVDWTRVYGYPGGYLDPGGEIARGGTIRILSNKTMLKRVDDVWNPKSQKKPHINSWKEFHKYTQTD